MATLSDLRTKLARHLRDTSNDTFSTDELDDLINQGIDAVSEIRPRQVVQTVGTVAASTYSYAVSDFSNIYRVDLYESDGTYRTTLPPTTGEGPNSGWELHGGVLYTPPDLTYTVGDTIRVFGYGGYTQLSASTSTTDLDTTLQWALMVFAQAEGFQRLIVDRVKFQQWQTTATNTDVTALALASMAGQARGRWREEKNRLRSMRKGG